MDCDPSSLVAASKCYCKIPRSMWPRINIDLLCEIANAPAGGCQHDTVDDWVVRVGVNGGTTDGLEPGGIIYDALCDFCTSLDTYSLTAKMKSVCCLVPGGSTPSVASDMIRAITPVIVGSGLDPWTNTGFIGSDLTVDGLKGNGTNWLDTGVNATSEVAINNIGLTCYNMTAGNDNSSVLACGLGTTLLNLQCDDATGNSLFDAWNFTSGAGRIIGSNSNWVGFLSGNRNPSNPLMCLYKGSSAGFSTVVACHNGTGGTRPNESISAFVRRAGGTSFNQSSKRLSFLAVHEGLTQAECQNFFNSIQALRIALGGGHV